METRARRRSHLGGAIAHLTPWNFTGWYRVRMAPQERITLLVEGQYDQMLLGWILEAAGLPMDRIDFAIAGEKGVRSVVQSLPENLVERIAVLIDLDERSVPDAQARAREKLADPPVRVFCAVPTIEAWLFADDHLAEEQGARDEESLAILRRIPMPEEIPTPKELARTIFGLPQHCGTLRICCVYPVTFCAARPVARRRGDRLRPRIRPCHEREPRRGPRSGLGARPRTPALSRSPKTTW
jgi:hypothetical protein